MTSTTDRKMTISEFVDLDFYEGYIYELIDGEIMRRTSPNLDPRNQTIEVYELQNGIFEMISYAEESGEIESNVLEGFKLEVENIFT